MMNYLGLLSLLLFSSVELLATHIRGAEITYKRISGEFFTYQFTLTGFTDTDSPVGFGDGRINFGDGQEAQLDTEASSFERGTFLGKNQETEIYRVTIIHTYVAPGFYVVSYREPNRNDEVVNINRGNSVQTPFYLESSLLIDPLVGSNDSPILTNFPIDRGIVGQTFTHNPWAIDPDGDSLVYRSLTPLQDNGQVVPNYNGLNNPIFYTSPFDWNFGNENGTGPAAFEINPFTGDMKWDAPGNLLQNSNGPFSEYTVAFMVEEWRKVEGSWRRIGYVTRDMQIIITGQENGRPDFEIPEEALLTDMENIQETLTFEDPDGNPIKVEFFGDVFDLENNPMSISPLPDDFTNGPHSLSFDWTPLPDHQRERPYYVHLKVTDAPADPEMNPSVTYKTWVLSFTALPDVITDLNDEPEAQHFNLFPNPATNTIKWQLAAPVQNGRLMVFNSLGQQTISLDLTSSRVDELDVSKLARGMYSVKLYNGKSFYFDKFIKK